MKKLLFISLLAMMFLFAGCSDADIASENLSTAADYFKIDRRIVFYNGITGDYMLEIDGRCSLGNNRTETVVKSLTKTNMSNTLKCRSCKKKNISRRCGLF